MRDRGSPNDVSPPREPSSLYGESPLPPLAKQLDSLSSRLEKGGALGLIVVDATPLLEIERLHGAGTFRRTLGSLTDRLRARLHQEIGEDFRMTAGVLEEEHILVFIPRSREDVEFYSQELPLLTAELRAYVAVCLKGIIYPYLYRTPDIPVGAGLAFNRPFRRIERQIRTLVEATLRTAYFERERVMRERSVVLEKILLEENVSTVYEPIVQINELRAVGYEALTRGPIGSGMETPLSLFSSAEDCGLEFELDNLCRRQALRNARGVTPDQKLFLNILPSSIHDPDFAGSRVREMLGQHGLAPRNLVLEISERQAISNYPIFREAIDHFQKLGFEIALDDTGAGFASLEAALELSPRYLKIDMSLVRGIEANPQKQVVLRGLQNLAGTMNSIVIAEGIETESELQAIRELGIEHGQGFLFGRGGSLALGEASNGED